MDGCVLAGCGAFFVVGIVLGWLLLHRKRGQPIQRTLVIAECIQPQLQCKPVPCQHPYYRVISECSEKPIEEQVRRDSCYKIQMPQSQNSKTYVPTPTGNNGKLSRSSVTN
ncbi:hypothetical protein JTE90_008328 [Oedothorax gibbosus]|uniref:Uncharacterized protein n=1 Tax=Oedothorax gibbosus TaxID=931172 RepID=A0AAV6TYG1_9ARAC|nr:hypothetical protein JTE90_008328 [Oedothorax gibbosus]